MSKLMSNQWLKSQIKFNNICSESTMKGQIVFPKNLPQGSLIERKRWWAQHGALRYSTRRSTEDENSAICTEKLRSVQSQTFNAHKVSKTRYTQSTPVALWEQAQLCWCALVTLLLYQSHVCYGWTNLRFVILLFLLFHSFIWSHNCIHSHLTLVWVLTETKPALIKLLQERRVHGSLVCWNLNKSSPHYVCMCVCVCAQVYQVYARRSPEEVYDILRAVGADYVVLENSICYERRHRRGCRLRDLLDLANGHVGGIY